jgi:hypothetical protein
MDIGAYSLARLTRLTSEKYWMMCMQILKLHCGKGNGVIVLMGIS